jgi:hypothetical protein
MVSSAFRCVLADAPAMAASDGHEQGRLVVGQRFDMAPAVAEERSRMPIPSSALTAFAFVIGERVSAGAASLKRRPRNK